MKILIGITGGIGSGKSAVTHHLRELNETVICADEVSRQIVEPGEPGASALLHEYGGAFFLSNGMLDRKKLAAHVFCNKERTLKLNNLLHPLIVSRIFEKASECNGRVFIDAALLIQAGMHDKVDYVWVITADFETRIKRVMNRDGIGRDEVMNRIQNQMSDEEMTRYASEIIDNNGSIAELCETVDKLLMKPEYSR